MGMAIFMGMPAEKRIVKIIIGLILMTFITEIQTKNHPMSRYD